MLFILVSRVLSFRVETRTNNTEKLVKLSYRNPHVQAHNNPPPDCFTKLPPLSGDNLTPNCQTTSTLVVFTSVFPFTEALPSTLAAAVGFDTLAGSILAESTFFAGSGTLYERRRVDSIRPDTLQDLEWSFCLFKIIFIVFLLLHSRLR